MKPMTETAQRPLRGSDAPQERSALERVLGAFAEVHGGEGITVVLLTLDVFLLLTCYYLLKTAREPLILASGAEIKSYSSAGQAMLLVPATYLYGKVAERVGRMRLIAIVSCFFAVNLALFFVAGKAHVPYLGVAFFLWVGVFNYMIIAQFWSFAADIYAPSQGKRLFAILGIGSTVGAVAGSAIARVLFEPVGAYGLMLAAAGFLLLSLLVTSVVNARERDRGKKKSTGESPAEAPLAKGGGFAMILNDRYLLLLAALSFFLNWANTSGEYILDRVLLETARLRVPPDVDVAAWTGRFIGEFKADYFLYVNVASVLLQLFVVSRVIKYLGVRFSIVMTPLVSLAGYSTLAFLPILTLILIEKVTENALDYSLENTSRQALWLVTSRGAKYKAKSIIDTFIVRAGDLCSAAVTGLGAYLHLATVHFIVVNVGVVLCWTLVAVMLTRASAARAGNSELSSEGGRVPAVV